MVPSTSTQTQVVTVSSPVYNTIYQVGDQVEATWKTNTVSGIAEYDFTKLGSLRVVPVGFGPRALWVKYSENFENKNLTRNTTRSATKSFKMYGGGGFVSVNAAPLLTAVMRRSPISVSPSLYVAGAYGKGNGMEYLSSEITLRMLLGARVAWGVPLPRISTEFGYVRWSFKENRDISGGAVLGNGALFQSFKNTDVTTSSFMARATVTF